MAKISLLLVQKDFGFEATDEAQCKVRYDNPSEAEPGKQFGVSPMQALLMSMVSCSGIDIVMILKKKRKTIELLQIDVEGEREKGVTPALWKKAHMHFVLRGDMNREAAVQAIELSVNKYCSVAETLRRAGCEITWELSLNNGETV